MDDVAKRPGGKQLSAEEKERRAGRKELTQVRMRMTILSETIKNSMKERSELKAKSVALADKLGVKRRGKKANVAGGPEAS